MMVIGLIIKDSLLPSQLGQNRHNMWRHEIHCDTMSYQCQQRERGGRGFKKNKKKSWAKGIKYDGEEG